MKVVVLSPMKRRLAKFGNRFLLEFFIEAMHGTIVKGIRAYLAPVKSEDIPEIIKQNLFPPLKGMNLSIVTDNAELIKTISAVRIMEFIGEARPDLATAIQEMGMPGAEYIVKLRAYLLDLAMHPENALGKSTDYKPELEMAKFTCSKCKKSWVAKKVEASEYDKCPFCGAGKND